MLSREQLVLNLAICDAVALPFELVPSDVPLSILEVMALGIPLITSDVGCIPEMVPEGTGIKVHPRNIALLSEAIITLAGDKQLRLKLAKMGREQALAWSSINDNHQAWNTLVNETT
jgi:phosphatidyl-myo-inositol dimannoside synthase